MIWRDKVQPSFRHLSVHPNQLYIPYYLKVKGVTENLNYLLIVQCLIIIAFGLYGIHLLEKLKKKQKKL